MKLFSPEVRIALCLSIFLIIAVGTERYLAVCRPHHYRQLQVPNHIILKDAPVVFRGEAVA